MSSLFLLAYIFNLLVTSKCRLRYSFKVVLHARINKMRYYIGRKWCQRPGSTNGISFFYTCDWLKVNVFFFDQMQSSLRCEIFLYTIGFVQAHSQGFDNEEALGTWMYLMYVNLYALLLSFNPLAFMMPSICVFIEYLYVDTVERQPRIQSYSFLYGSISSVLQKPPFLPKNMTAMLSLNL